MTSKMAPFHQSIAVEDLNKARAFYIDLLGCQQTRAIPGRIEFNFFGHHVVAHLAPEEARYQSSKIMRDGAAIAPIRHFGIVLPIQEWHTLVNLASAERHQCLDRSAAFGVRESIRVTMMQSNLVDTCTSRSS